MCKLFQKTSKLFDIELLYLPSYSPNLNLIERMWKFVERNAWTRNTIPILIRSQKLFRNASQKLVTIIRRN